MSQPGPAALPEGRPARSIPVVAWLVCLGFGIALIAGALILPASRTADVGPGRIPLLVGVAVAALSAVCLIRQLTGRGEAAELAKSRTAMILLVLLIGYCALIPLIGLITSTVIFMMAVMLWLDGVGKWLRSALITIVFAGLIYALFTWVIATPLP
ncbi:MAG: Tripartite tricarboxylate transporter TctB family [Devosia sp.]|nr:Tripartite tricarboxylate transporter TctB family [Devosia sp.]